MVARAEHDELARRLSEAANAGDDPMDKHDLRMLRGAKVVLDAGFPEAALVQLARVYADAHTRVAEAEVHLFHFYVHEALKAAGLSGDELRHRKSMREQLLPVAELLTRYFHREAMLKAVREDMLLPLTGVPPRPAQSEHPVQVRLSIVFLDISSYTPITEIMGDAVAAKIVERFSELVREDTARFDAASSIGSETHSSSSFRIHAPRSVAPWRSIAARQRSRSSPRCGEPSTGTTCSIKRVVISAAA